MPELIATIDVGTNTAHLLLSHITDDGQAVPMHSETRFVRLGQGIDATGEIHRDALDRLRTALISFAATAEKAGVANVLVAGTSASRDTKNPEELISFVKRETGLNYEIISGEDEALLTSIGAMSAVNWRTDSALIVDIGGGSTELTHVARDGETISVIHSTSVDVGSVRVAERCFSRQPPVEGEADNARKLIDKLLETLDAPHDNPLFVGAAGTIRALVMVHAGVRSWREFPEGDVAISREECHMWCERLLRMDHDEILALNPQVMQGRADVLPAGVLILDKIFTFVGANRCVVSPRGLRHGLAIRYASLKKARGA